MKTRKLTAAEQTAYQQFVQSAAFAEATVGGQRNLMDEYFQKHGLAINVRHEVRALLQKDRVEFTHNGVKHTREYSTRRLLLQDLETCDSILTGDVALPHGAWLLTEATANALRAYLQHA